MEEKLTVGQKVKGHLKKHKHKYIAVGTLGVGVGVGYYVSRKFGHVIPDIETTVKSINESTNTLHDFTANDNGVIDVDIDNSINTTINNVVNMCGHTVKLVKRLSDGVIFGSVGEAAKAAGVSKSAMSKHINGHEDNINGELYQIVGLGTI